MSQELTAMFNALDPRNAIWIPRSFVRWTGCPVQAAFLQRLVERATDSGSFQITYADWHDDIFISRYQLKSAVDWCISKGFLTVHKVKGSHAHQYIFDRCGFADALAEFLHQ